MLDLLLLPSLLLVALALRAVRRGEHRLHGHLMAATFTLVGLWVVLWPRSFPPHHLQGALTVLGLAGFTIFLGRRALAWREDRSRNSHAPRMHRTAGVLTLISFASALTIWLLRTRS
jgi:hypothetical protein